MYQRIFDNVYENSQPKTSYKRTEISPSSVQHSCSVKFWSSLTNCCAVVSATRCFSALFGSDEKCRENHQTILSFEELLCTQCVHCSVLRLTTLLSMLYSRMLSFALTSIHFHGAQRRRLRNSRTVGKNVVFVCPP